MGEYARNKIREVFSWLNVEERVRMNKSRWEQMDMLMKLIGDPFMKMQLKQLFHKKTGILYAEADN